MHAARDNQAATAAAESLDSARPRVAALRCFAGFDAFIDRIIDVVDARTAPGAGGYTRIDTIDALARRIAGAAGRSANLELVVKQEKLGGNAALLASGLRALGVSIDFVGAVAGDHRVARDFRAACARTAPVAPPGETDALEFDDGKLMLGKPEPLDRVTWPAVLEACAGPDALALRLADADILVLANWTQHRALGDIWSAMARDIIPKIEPPKRPRLCFIDTADPAKRADDELSDAVRRLRELDAAVPVTLGLNIAEAARMLRVAGRPDPFAETHPAPERMQRAAEALRDALGLSCVVVHARWGAGAASSDGGAACAGPYVRKPRLSTGAGDHFNTGFALAGALGLPLDQRLACASACAGRYVRDAHAPTLDALIDFLRALPEGEPLHD